MDWTTLTKEEKNKLRGDAQLRVSLGVYDHHRRRQTLAKLADIVVTDDMLAPHFRGKNKPRVARMLQLLADAAEKDMDGVASALHRVLAQK